MEEEKTESGGTVAGQKNKKRPASRKKRLTKKSKAEVLDDFMKKRATEPEPKKDPMLKIKTPTLQEEIRPAMEALANTVKMKAPTAEIKPEEIRPVLRPAETNPPLQNDYFADNEQAENKIMEKNKQKKETLEVSTEEDKNEGEAGEGDADDSGRRKRIMKAALITAGALVFLGLLGAAGFFYYKYKSEIKRDEPVKQETAMDYVTKVEKIMLLPQGEEPTLATVTDVEKLKEQVFFANAQNGDKVLLYIQGKKAVLYRPSENKIIEVSAVSSSSQLGSPEAAQENRISAGSADVEQAPENENLQSQAAETAKVVVFNGTNKKGLAKNIAEKIKEISGLEISSTANARGSYAKTLVVDLSGKSGALAKSVAEKIGGEVGELPEGETKPEADVLVIGGDDAKVN